ncbi:hypothetical protein CSUI_004390 [Cystoisospora suis]|uniref:Uncharacterized protein n=1 Tax=Cystoisospora suis TaxID=483139 RepID=A0A2C6L1W1_9APIC|nr:hypothetical protein CSUI_004390 [Cystoisospora suis]
MEFSSNFLEFLLDCMKNQTGLGTLLISSRNTSVLRQVHRQTDIQTEGMYTHTHRYRHYMSIWIP